MAKRKAVFKFGPDRLAVLRDVCGAAGTKPAYVANVVLTLGPGGLYVFATNSYIMAVRKVSSERKARKPWSVAIDAEELAKCTKEALKQKPTIFTFAMSKEGVELTNGAGSRSLTASSERIIDWPSMIPEKRDPIGRVAFNPNFLSQLTKALGVNKADAMGVDVEFTGPEKPIVVARVVHGDGFGMIMPIRVPESKSYTASYAGSSKVAA